jgi:hypothetical protein
LLGKKFQRLDFIGGRPVRQPGAGEKFVPALHKIARFLDKSDGVADNSRFHSGRGPALKISGGAHEIGQQPSICFVDRLGGPVADDSLRQRFDRQ